MNLVRLRQELRKTAPQDLQDLDELSYDDRFTIKRHRR
jgi:hypothetical protein